MKKEINIIFWVITIIVVIASILVPNAGRFALLDGFCLVLLFVIAGIYVVYKIFHSDIIKIGKILITIGCVVVIMWLSANFVIDLVYGTKTVALNNVTTQYYQGKGGIISRHYYIYGTDSTSKTYKLEISADDYTAVAKKSNVIVEYYPHLGRVVRCN